jgi:LDH2 family malate/lactate/ureidoglycolate dehydrogenase
LYKAEALHQFAQGVFEKLGLRSADAEILANHLVWADLRGITWLGIRKIPQYGSRFRACGPPPKLESKTVLDTPSVVVVDDNRGCAVVSGHRLMKTLIEKARSTGICMGLLRNTSISGAMGYYANLAAEQGMIGMVNTDCPPLVAAPGGATKLIGNQAFAIASPAGKNPPLLLDMATSAVTLAKLHQIEARSQKAPENSVLDASGKPTTNPTEGLLGTLLPMAGHRGFGLAVMWEIFTGVLAGVQILQRRSCRVYDKDMNLSFLFMLAIDPASVMPYADFQARVDRVIDEIHASPPAPGSGLDRIIVPGERSQATAARRKREGIPIPQATVETLSQFGKELGIAWPGKVA